MSVEGPERFTGGCLCGSLRIVASGRPCRVGVCHCLDCRKHHGALFHACAYPKFDTVCDAHSEPLGHGERQGSCRVRGFSRYASSPALPG
ncbi:hypothetical protein D7Y27_35050 [Corallococcus sp. AB004]|nr:hypothetical protein D7Y27_35050 [Corallococcus sp. AB004]